MAWVGQLGSGSHGAAQEHDVLLSVSEEGEIAFWVPENGLTSTTSTGAGNGISKGLSGKHSQQMQQAAWKCTGKVRTGRKGLAIARCSSVKKSVLGLYRFVMKWGARY